MSIYNDLIFLQIEVSRNESLQNFINKNKYLVFATLKAASLLATEVLDIDF